MTRYNGGRSSGAGVFSSIGSGGGGGGSGGGGGGGGGGGPLSASKRALALRLIFDGAALSGILAAYKLRARGLAKALRVRGYTRLHRFVTQPPVKTLWWLFAGGVLTALWYRYNRSRWEQARQFNRRREDLRVQLDKASCYEDYIDIALKMESVEEAAMAGGALGRQSQQLFAHPSSPTKPASSFSLAALTSAQPSGRAAGTWSSGGYDKELIEEQLRLLRAQRASGNVEEMMFGLRADILRNLGNMTDIGRKLHEPLWGVPRTVREYIEETRAQLRMISQEHDIPLQEKLAFLQETRHCFGRTALLLSGGGTLGTFHVGVARALNRRGCLPRVVAGSSVGSVVAAIMASRTPEELEEFFSEKHFWDLLPDMTFFSGRDFFSSIQHLMRTGALHDIDFFQRCLRALLGDLTFQEAYDRSGGRILCVCVCATRKGEKPRLLNYLTSPHLVVWSAVAASCAFPSLFPPQPLLAKSRNGAFVPWQPEGKLGARRWRDGSLEADLPMQALTELFNVNYFIVSQTNPHIVPILRVKRWFASQGPACAMLAGFLESEWKHRCRQILDLVPWVDAFDFCKLFGQQWEGNVTVVMAYTWSQFKKIAINPTREFLYETATMGEREMWPKLATIESNCGIEMQLDECVRSLREKLSKRQGYGLKTRGRVPSWNTINYCSRDSYMHMPSASQGGGTTSVGGGSMASSMSRDSSAASLSEFVVGASAALASSASAAAAAVAAAAAAGVAAAAGAGAAAGAAAGASLSPKAA
eukprot:CAMPEP_0197581708 /NCGR_PEP_ID=MMETSP1326-20131121/5135_1 /TAXON_ID=1155430 /ORGANISM="Genus nov. species nov., Strain RCC2288" /LENGTH=758 /DNA_ID=CAMNT_0043145655 /DNA_START=507 /DNA_END=2779 /DNA_ORIENTATION=-